jgi:DNA-binding response OmpR family regulator/curved DNA-binding protein CbpA
VAQASILIVDDDRSTQRVLADALTKQGFAVTVERDGEWAVKTFEKKQFDAVLLDLLLPALSGYEVARALRDLPHGRQVPIIMISGVYKNAIHQREAVQKHGAYAFLEKPIDLKRLADTLKGALADRYPHPEPPKPPPPPMEDDDVTGEHMADDLQREEVQVVERAAKTVHAASSQLTAAGDFAQRSFAEVLAEIYRWRANGALLIRREKVKKIVYFREGTPQLVKSNLLVECLGRILVREKMISPAECAESLKRMKATQRMQGTVLVAMGCISPHNLQYALHLQLAEKLYDAFRWEVGAYQFNPQVTLPLEPIALAMTCAQLILEGVKRGYDEKRLARAFEGTEHLYVHQSDEPLYALQDAGLGEEERELLMLADGHKTVGTLRALEVLPALDTDRLLFAMRCAQMIDLRQTANEGRPRVSFADLAASRQAEVRQAPQPVPPPLPVAPPPLPGPPREAAPTAPPVDLPWKDAPLSHPKASQRSPVPALAPPVERPPPSPPRPRSQSTGSLMPELSEVVSLPAPTNEESVSRERLATKVAAMRRMNYFELLGVQPGAGREEIKRAYFTLAREYHPDRHFPSAASDLRQLSQQLYDLISTAHDTLTDPAERTRYLAELAQGKKREEDEDVGRILAAEGKFQRGEELMRRRSFAEAHRHFGEAIALYGHEGEFYAWLGWSLFQKDPSRSDDALRAIEQGLALNPRLDKGYLFLGYIHKAGGRPDRAEKQFEKAMQCNPDCTEALRELRLSSRARK